MKRQILFLLILVLWAPAWAQTKFDQAVGACRLAVEAVSGAYGGQDDMRRAADKLSEAEWVPFNPARVDGKKDLAIGSHMVFHEKYFRDLADNHNVKKKAKEYYEEDREGVRGFVSQPRLCTRVLKSKSDTEYSFYWEGEDSMRVAVVAEAYGLVNLKVTAKNRKTGQTITIPVEKSSEYSGAPYRVVRCAMPKGTHIVTISISNKYKKDRSCAIIVD